MMPTPYQDDPRRQRGLRPLSNPMADRAGMGGMLEPPAADPVALPPNPQMLTPANQQAITRPRMVGDALPSPPVAMPEPDTSQTEQPNGLNSVGQTLAKYGPHYAYGPAHVDEGGKMVGTVPGTDRRAHLEALGIADPTSEVRQTPEGWQIDPAHEKGRGAGILHGLLQGALEGAVRTGKWQGALGGAAAGATAGGISPRFAQAMDRTRETGHEQTEYDRELGNTAKQQQLGLQRSQTEENYAQAERQRTGNRKLVQGNDGVWRSVNEDTGLDTQGQQVTGKDPDATTPYQQGQLKAGADRNKETKRYHDQLITQRKNDRAARIAIAKKRAADKPSPSNEASLRAVIEDDAEQNALQRRHETDEQIAKLRTQREKLTFSSVPKGDGTFGWEEDPARGFESKTSVAQIDKQIADLQKESDNQQKIAETAASNKRKAEAKAKAGGQAPAWHQRGSESRSSRGVSAAPPEASASKGNVSRAKFRTKFPDYAQKSDAEVDAAIGRSGYSPIP